MIANITCPACGHQHTPHVAVKVEKSRHASKRLATSECVDVCPQCSSVLILSLHPAPQEAITR